MLQTLVDIVRTHRFPFIAEHHYNAQRWLVLGFAEYSEVVFEVKALERDSDSPSPGEAIAQVYGGYDMWRFEKEVDKKTEISPEEQRALKEKQRRENNEKAKKRYNLKAGDSPRSRSVTRPVATKEKENGNVVHVDFTKKNKF